jgi:hypothetical protein
LLPHFGPPIACREIRLRDRHVTFIFDVALTDKHLTRWLKPGSDPTLKPHIAWYWQPKPVTTQTPDSVST